MSKKKCNFAAQLFVSVYSIMKKYVFFWFLLLLFPLGVMADTAWTGANGVVVDAETGETLPFVQIVFINPASDGKAASGVGTTSDMDGKFSLTTSKGYTTMTFQMMGYKTEMLTVRPGQVRSNIKVKMYPDVYGLQDIIVTPKHNKRDYRRKNNPAVELIENVIAHKDSNTVQCADRYTADSYARMSFAIDNFTPNYQRGIWKTFNFVEKYVDTTQTYPCLTVSIREHLNKEYYQRKPHREKKMLDKKRIFGIEDVIGSDAFQENINLLFKDVDLNEDNMNLLFNRFVSPLNSSIATSFYQYYIMDTILVDGYPCIDLAFVPVNSESFGFTGHLYIVNDSTYKIKRYAINIPPHINLNYVNNFSIEHSYVQLEDGKWAPDRTNTYAKFSVFGGKKGILAKQTKLYTKWDFESEIDKQMFSVMSGSSLMNDSAAVRVASREWDNMRPEPLSKSESSVVELVQEFEANKLFNSLAMLVNAVVTEYIPSTPIEKQDFSKWDFGPLWSFLSWNKLEGVRLRIGGMTTPVLNPQVYLHTYVAFGTSDLRPKYNATLYYTFDKHKWTPFDKLRHHLMWGVQYDVEEPGMSEENFTRDNLFSCIPFSKPTMPNAQYVFHARTEYVKEWKNFMVLKAGFDFSHVEAAGALTYDRVAGYSDGMISLTHRTPAYFNYEGKLQFRYSPGTRIPVDRQGRESQFFMDKDAPIFNLTHYIGYMDDRKYGGHGFLYNRTEISVDKRFWFGAFGCLDLSAITGISWQKAPYTKLFVPTASTNIFLTQRGFNLMHPMEFMMDQHVSWFLQYHFKGWILNRIPGINRLKLRGVVGFSGVYGGLTDKNNPYLAGNEGLYAFPGNATYDVDNYFVAGSTSSPIGKLPYMELTAGFENVLKFIRIDYVRRLTYNDYMLPDGIHRRKIGAWGRNGVKLSVRFDL